MTKDEALRLALEALETLHDENMDYLTRNKLGGENNQCMVFAREAITAIKAALEAKDAPVGDFYITKAMAKHIKNLEVDWNICASGSKKPTDKKVVPVFVGDTTPPQQEAKDEPVAWISPTELLVMRGNALGGAKDWRVNVGLKPEDGDVGLYTNPPQRTWVGLTDEEILVKCESVPDYDIGNHDLIKFAEAIEAKLKAKNT